MIKKLMILSIFLFTSLAFSKEVEHFSCPVPAEYENKISSHQGLREALTEEQAGASTSGMWHQGIDYAVPDKTPITAAKGGIVRCVYPSYHMDLNGNHTLYMVD